MKYISTRGAEASGVSSAYAIKTGLASDGGLFMPESIPEIDLDFIKELSSLPYTEISCGSSLSVSTALSILALSAVTLLKKRKKD